jgi:hypothetical protein
MTDCGHRHLGRISWSAVAWHRFVISIRQTDVPITKAARPPHSKRMACPMQTGFPMCLEARFRTKIMKGEEDGETRK